MQHEIAPPAAAAGAAPRAVLSPSMITLSRSRSTFALRCRLSCWCRLAPPPPPRRRRRSRCVNCDPSTHINHRNAQPMYIKAKQRNTFWRIRLHKNVEEKRNAGHKSFETMCTEDLSSLGFFFQKKRMLYNLISLYRWWYCVWTGIQY